MAGMEQENINSLRKIFDNRADLGIEITKAAGAYKINPEDIEIEEGFNKRDYSAPDTAAHIQNLLEAIKANQDLGLFKVAIKQGRILARDGHCRTLAIREALALNIPVKPILVEEVDPEAEAKCPELIILTSNNGLKLKPLERASTYVSIIEKGFDTKYLAKIEGISEVAVRNLIKAHNLPEDVKAFINQNVVSVTTALDLFKIHKNNLGKVIRERVSDQQISEPNQPSESQAITENQLTIFNIIESSSDETSPPKQDEWDLLSSFSHDAKLVQPEPIIQKPATPQQNINRKDKPRLTIGDFGAKTIKGEQSKNVIHILSKLVAKIENMPHEEYDSGSISLTLDQELIESILTAHYKIKG